MNPVGSLNLSTHDEGVAAIANFPLALDWLSIAYPPIINNVLTFPPTTTSPLPHPSQPIPTQSPPHMPQLQLPDPISKNQASSSLVRHVRPYASREVFAPCFQVARRFILGRTLGNLYVPSELEGQLANERCAEARFVLDLQNGSIVEVRQYAEAKTILCIAYAALRAEFLSIPPVDTSRVEITYRRDPSIAQTQPGLGQVFDIMSSGGSRGGEDSSGAVNMSQDSWHHFCINYPMMFPTGPLIATVTCQPGSASATFKKESIIVSVNDAYAMTFSTTNQAGHGGTSQARRIAPKRLLPRPAT